MIRPWWFSLRCAAAALALVTLGACTTTGDSRSVAPAATVAAAAEPPSAPPTTVSSLPDGVYRTSFGQAGSSTLTIKDGTYDLACGAQGDCGGTPLKWRPYVDVGTLRGAGNSVWFVPDAHRKARLTGCVLASVSFTGCGPADPYRFTWQLSSKGLSFQHFFGLGDQAGQADGYLNFTAQPWTKIE